MNIYTLHEWQKNSVRKHWDDEVVIQLTSERFIFAQGIHDGNTERNSVIRKVATQFRVKMEYYREWKSNKT